MRNEKCVKFALQVISSYGRIALLRMQHSSPALRIICAPPPSDRDPQTILICSDGFFTLPLLVLATENSAFRKPVKYGVHDFRPGGIELLYHWNIGVQSVEIRLLLRTGFNRSIEVVPDRLPKGESGPAGNT